jgi:hypothetical protein
MLEESSGVGDLFEVRLGLLEELMLGLVLVDVWI